MIELQDENGHYVVVQQGESCNIVSYFEFNGQVFTLSGLLSVRMTLYEEQTGEIIIDDVDVKNDNYGVVAEDGELTLSLDADQNIIVNPNTAVGGTERHIALITWTWSDDGERERTGKTRLSFLVQRLV